MNDSTLHSQQEQTEPLSGRALLLQDIGIKLTQARDARYEPISKPVQALKIPINHLQALESGNWDALPGDVYVVGFLRQYSKYLNIDLADEIEHLKNSDYSLIRPLTFPDPPVAPSRRWAWLMGAAFVLLFVLFNVMVFDGDLNDDGIDGMLDREVMADVTPLEHAPDVATVKSDAVEIAPLSLSAPSGSFEQELEQPTEPLIESSTIEQREDTSFTEPRPVAPVVHAFRFEAVTAPVWLQIFLPNKAGNAKGRLLKEILLKQGRYSTIRYATESLWITCGNALALRIKVDNKTVIDTGGLSLNGKKILRDYHFDLLTINRSVR